MCRKVQGAAQTLARECVWSTDDTALDQSQRVFETILRQTACIPQSQPLGRSRYSCSLDKGWALSEHMALGILGPGFSRWTLQTPLQEPCSAPGPLTALVTALLLPCLCVPQDCLFWSPGAAASIGSGTYPRTQL